MALCDRITADDEESAVAVFEALLLTGIGMGFTKTSRPASGTEHILSHFWECKKLLDGKLSDFHGKKVGVATVTLCDLYHKATAITPDFRPDTPDWDRVYAAFGENIKDNIIRENSPPITDRLDPADIASKWSEIARIVREELPTKVELLDIMHAAGAATTYSQIDTDESLARDVITYHPYMRDKIVLSRILRMTDIEPTEMVSVK
jgi:glycerol-1-phosphate dehydrogenase [NAD(P)+]